jgi:hypothetical protein
VQHRSINACVISIVKVFVKENTWKSIMHFYVCVCLKPYLYHHTGRFLTKTLQ